MQQLARELAERADRTPDDVAVIDAVGVHTLGEVMAAARDLATALEESLGGSPTVLVQADNTWRTLATAIAVGTVTIAGTFFGMRSSFAPLTGPTQLIFAFETVVIGGIGSLWGTLVGGIVLGVAQTVGAQINPQYPVLFGNLVFLAVLIVRSSRAIGGRTQPA
jgi:branched-chain amino acid transport system permease protein